MNIDDLRDRRNTGGQQFEDSADLLTMENSTIGAAAQRAAMDPEVTEILSKQMELQGPLVVNKNISGVSVTSEWQGKHPGHPTADFFLTRELQNGKLLIVVGDLAGEGVAISYDPETGSEALSYYGGKFVCELHEKLNGGSELDTITGPGDAISLIDRIVTEEPVDKGQNMLRNSYMVMGALVVEPSNRTVEASVHGTPPIFIREPDGNVQVVKGTGLPIGLVVPLGDVEVESVGKVSSGAEIIVMTDGLPDQRLEGWSNNLGLTQRVIDVLTPEDNSFFGATSEGETGVGDLGPRARSDLFSTDRDRETSLVRLVEQARESAVDDWGYIRVKL